MSKLTVDAVLDNLDQAVDFIAAEAQQIGFDKREINKICLASEEILVNIINYAYKGKKPGTFELDCSAIKDKNTGMKISVIDSGIPFDPLADAPSAGTHLPVEERSIGGLGIHLVKSIMNKMSYERKGEKNVLTLIKFKE